MRTLLPLLVPGILLSGCASLKPATFEAFRRQGDLAGVTHECADIRELAGTEIAIEEVAYSTLRFAPPLGGDIAVIEWANTPCAHARLAYTVPGKATRETAAAEINKLGVKVSEPWGWVHGIGVVYRSDEPQWFGLFDPASGRIGIAKGDYSNEFKRPGLIATLPQLDRGIEGALAAGETATAAALLVQREAWFGPAPVLASRLAAQKSAPVIAPVKPMLAAISPAHPLELWQSTLKMLRTAKPDEAARLEPELRLRHAAAVAHLQAQIAASAPRNKLATTAALHLQLSALLGEDAKGAQRLVSEELLKRWLAGILVAAPVPGNNAAVPLGWGIPAANTVIANTHDAMRLAPAATVMLGGIEAVGVEAGVGTGTASTTVRDPHGESLAAQRSAKQAEINAAKESLADAKERLAALERAANAGNSSGNSQPYGRTDRTYNNRPGSDTYKDTYNTSVYRSSGSGTITPEMRAVGLEVDRAESTIHIRSQELASLPEPGSITRTETFPTQEQQWRGKVRRMVTVTMGGFTATVPAEIDLANYRYSRHERQGQASARNDWKTPEQVVALASAELETNIAKQWPRVLREASLARLAAQAGNDITEERWGRHFFGEADAQTQQELQVPSLAAAQELRAKRLARGTSDFISRLNKPTDIGNNVCGGAPVMSTDGALVTWCGAVYDADSGVRLFQLTPGLVNDARFSADGKQLALYNGYRAKIIVWNTSDGKKLSVRDGKAIRDSDVGAPVPAPAAWTLTRNTSPESVVISDNTWVRPKTHDYNLAFATGAPVGNGKLRIDKGSRDGIRKWQPATVLSKHINTFESNRWQVTEVSEHSALLEGPALYVNADAFAKESVTVVVRGVDLVW